MYDDLEKIANAALHQRTELMNSVQRMTEALVDIRELTDGRADIDHNGNANLAMQILTIVHIALKEDR